MDGMCQQPDREGVPGLPPGRATDTITVVAQRAGKPFDDSSALSTERTACSYGPVVSYGDFFAGLVGSAVPLRTISLSSASRR